MGEETRNAKSVVPKAMFWSIVVNILLGLLMIVTFAVCDSTLRPCRCDTRYCKY